MNKPVKMPGGVLWLLNLLYPKECVHCGRALDYRNVDFLCPGCLQYIFWIRGPVCSVCGLPFRGELSHPQECPSCKEEKPAFHRARSVFRMAEAGRSLLLRYKYERQTYLSPPAARWLKEGGEEFYNWGDYDLILPVPLHHRKVRERGFNQSELLAAGLSRLTGVPLAKKKFVRARYTGTQTRLNLKERQENIKGAFRVKDRRYFWEKSLLLIDDVFTTGATVNECARALLKAHVRSVDVLTLARAV